jgi:hypothetical protein
MGEHLPPFSDSFGSSFLVFGVQMEELRRLRSCPIIIAAGLRELAESFGRRILGMLLKIIIALIMKVWAIGLANFIWEARGGRCSRSALT